jgi:hypothetical protein
MQCKYNIMNKTEVLSAFNNHMQEFFADVLVLFPEDNDIRVASTSLITMRKANPRLIINIWKQYITDKYADEIAEGNINFFIERNYDDDLKSNDQAAVILDKINTLREPMRQMGEDNLKKTVGYIQNLTKISKMYFM